jgi:hypothetical protein
MTGRLIVKTIAVVTLVGVGVVALAVAGFVGVLFYKAYVPERVSVTGRVTDSSGQPVKGIKVHAVPLPIRGLFRPSRRQDRDLLVLLGGQGVF